MMKTKIRESVLRWWVLSVIFVFINVSLFGQSIQTAIDRKDILIGEQIHYRLQFTLPSVDYRIEFNVPDSFEHFEILDKVKSDSTDPKGRYLVFQRIRLTSWDSGHWAIPSFPIKLRNAATNASYTLNTERILINVGYAPADSTGELRDIKPVMEVFYIDRSWMYIAAAILTALILLYILYRYLKKRPKKQKPLFDSKLTAFEEAMVNLKALESTDLRNSDALKSYYTSLGEILKKYYSRTKGRNLLTKTTAEMLLLFRENDVAPDAISMLAEAMRRGDAVKFAKYSPPENESRESLEQVRAVINYLNTNELKK